MDLEKLINLHNRTLEKRVNEDGYLKERLKARLKEKNRLDSSSLIFRFRKLMVVYSFIFLLLIFFNFKLIGWLSVEKSSRTHVITVNENPFQPVFPGSISQAYIEVIKWSE